MKRVKVTKRPEAREFTLKPNRLRMFIVYLCVFTLAVAIGLGIRWLMFRATFSPDWLEKTGVLTLLVIVGGSLVMSFTEYSRWTLRLVGGDRVEGPSGMFGERLTIPLDNIDWTRTRRSLANWLKIGNAIYANSRDRILVSPWFFSPAQFRELLERMDFKA